MDIAHLIASGASNFWIFIPTAIFLGALHGLEPGHSKTLMAAFIIAIRGTVTQAILLGLAATISHTAIVWIVALVGIYFFEGNYNSETTEPYFQLISGILIVLIALWMLRRTWKHQIEFENKHSPNEAHEIDTFHGILKLEISEVNHPPRFKISNKNHNVLKHFSASDITIETTRSDGSTQTFSFVAKNGFIESKDYIPKPHDFTARLILDHGHHHHDYDVEFMEHSPAKNELKTLNVISHEYDDPHELAHANDIHRRFSNRNITTGQIVIFGLTGGLIPCPASITVLLLCLQLKKLALGNLLVLCFSIGLAATMVTTGVIAALSVNQLTKRWSKFHHHIARRAPYFSSFLISIIGLYVAYQGFIKILS